MPLRPMSRVFNAAPGAATFFGSSEDGHSEVREQSVRDEMNDTGVLELIYGIKQQDQQQQHTVVSNGQQTIPSQTTPHQPGGSSALFQTPTTHKTCGAATNANGGQM